MRLLQHSVVYQKYSYCFVTELGHGFWHTIGEPHRVLEVGRAWESLVEFSRV